MPVRRSIIALLFLAFGLAATHPSNCCSCVEYPIEYYYAHADVVIVGKLLSVNNHYIMTLLRNVGALLLMRQHTDLPSVEAEVEVHSCLKGKLTGVVRLSDRDSHSSCAILTYLKPGEECVFFCKLASDGVLVTGGCTGTGKRIYWKNDDFKELEKLSREHETQKGA
jgi:hypothetical protein